MSLRVSKIVVPLISATAGGAIVLAALKASPTLRAKLENTESAQSNKSNVMIFDDILRRQEGIRDQFNSLFDDDFFGGSDPFAEKRMDGFGGPHSMGNPFDSWFSNKFGGGTIEDISKREDEQFVYYDIKVDDLKSTSVNTKIENGYITITGTVEKKSGSESDNSQLQSVFQGTFNRSFPLPEHVDAGKMQMLSEDDKIVLKFPKTKAS